MLPFAVLGLFAGAMTAGYGVRMAMTERPPPEAPQVSRGVAWMLAASCALVVAAALVVFGAFGTALGLMAVCSVYGLLFGLGLMGFGVTAIVLGNALGTTAWRCFKQGRSHLNPA